MPTVQRKTVRQLINEGAILAVQDGNHGELHPTQEDYVPEGIPFVMASDLKGNDLDLITCKFLPEGLASTLRKGFSLPGDVLLTHKGTLGLTAVVPTLDTPYIMLTPQVTYYRVNSDALRPEYLHYVFSSPEFQKSLLCHVREGTRPYVGITAQLDLEIEYPSIDVQSAVVEELIALDRLIQISQQSIKHLEEAARLIYTEWFVRLRFPGHKQARTGTHELPSGWQATSIGTVTSYLNRGVAPSYDDSSPKRVINQKCIRDRQLSMEQARNLANEISSEKWLQKGDVLINSTGTGTLGRVAQVREELDSVTVDTHVTIVRPRTEIPPWFFGQQLLRMEALFESLGEGATNQTELKRDRIRDTGFLLPSPQIMAAFDEKVEPMIEQIEVLRKQIAQLRQARDLLLPRLISGQLRL